MDDTVKLSNRPDGKLQSPRDLTRRAWLLLGLWEMGVTKLADVKRAMKVASEQQEEELLDLWMALEASDDPVVRRCRAEGLPPARSEMLPALPNAFDGQGWVFCRLCRQRITVLPCPVCSGAQLPEAAVEEPGAERGPPLPWTPTGAAPGSPQKIAVMYCREMCGLALHHPDDLATCSSDTMTSFLEMLGEAGKP